MKKSELYNRTCRQILGLVLGAVVAIVTLAGIAQLKAQESQQAPAFTPVLWWQSDFASDPVMATFHNASNATRSLFNMLNLQLKYGVSAGDRLMHAMAIPAWGPDEDVPWKVNFKLYISGSGYWESDQSRFKVFRFTFGPNAGWDFESAWAGSMNQTLIVNFYQNFATRRDSYYYWLIKDWTIQVLYNGKELAEIKADYSYYWDSWQEANNVEIAREGNFLTVKNNGKTLVDRLEIPDFKPHGKMAFGAKNITNSIGYTLLDNLQIYQLTESRPGAPEFSSINGQNSELNKTLSIPVDVTDDDGDLKQLQLWSGSWWENNFRPLTNASLFGQAKIVSDNPQSGMVKPYLEPYLELTSASDQSGTMMVPGLPHGESWRVKFDLLTPFPEPEPEGFSFAYGPLEDGDAISEQTFRKDDTLVVRLGCKYVREKNWQRTIEVWYGSQMLGQGNLGPEISYWPPNGPIKGVFVPVEVVREGEFFSVKHNGQIVLNRIRIPDSQVAKRFGFGARTVDDYNSGLFRYAIRNLEITRFQAEELKWAESGTSEISYSPEVESARPTLQFTPKSEGSRDVIISAIDSQGHETLKTVSFFIPPRPKITSNLSANGTEGYEFNYTILASNNATSYSASGLPEGLTINATSGIISGRPLAAGNSTITLSATNAGGMGTANLTLSISPNRIIGLSGNLSFGSVGVNSTASRNLTITNTGTGNLTINSISSNDQSFTLTGNTTNLVVEPGSERAVGVSFQPSSDKTFACTIMVNSTANQGNSTIAASGTGVSAPSIDLSALKGQTANGTEGCEFNYRIVASNNATSYSASGLPEGLTINATSGIISGRPLAAGNSTITLSATNAGGMGTANLTLSISPNRIIGLSGNLSFGSVGVNSTASRNLTITNTGTGNLTINSISSNDQSFTLTGNTTNLVVGPRSKRTVGVSFKPSSDKTFACTIMVNSTANKGNSTIAASGTGVSAPKIDLSALRGQPVTNKVGFWFNYQIRTVANNATRYTMTNYPTWLQLNSNSGLFSGRPDQPGTWWINITAINAWGRDTQVLIVKSVSK